MESENIDKYFSWLPIVNTIEDRLEDDSLINSYLPKKTIRKSTKEINDYLHKSRPKNYNEFVKCKKMILNKIRDNLDVSDDSELSDTDLKIYYSSFNQSNECSKNVHDLFMWSFIEKKGLKTVESEDTHDHSIWEHTINTSNVGCQSQVEGQSKYNGLKADGASTTENKYLRKISTKEIHNNNRGTSFINNNSNSINEPKKVPEKHEEEDKVVKIKTSATMVLRNKKINGIKKNLTSAINNVSLQMSETAEEDFTCDFIPDNFQAESTHIFSDTFVDTIRHSHKFSSNQASNQPRDSGIEEDSRDENTIHQNIKNNEKKVHIPSKTKAQNSLSSENSESYDGSKEKQSLKIIGDETLTKKYKIVAKNNKVLQPIVEENNAPSSELNNQSNGSSNHEVNNDSESDFKSIETDDEEEFTDGDNAKESSDEYHDVPDDNVLSFKDGKVFQPEESSVKNDSETDVDLDSQDSKYHHEENEPLRSRSPWVAKQYRDLKRLRLIDSSTDDTEIDLNTKDGSNTVTKQKVSRKNKKTEKLTNKTEKLSENHTTNKEEKSFINRKLTRNSNLEMSNSQFIRENGDTNANVEGYNTGKNKSLSNETGRLIENDNYSNSKIDSKNRGGSESDTADSHKSLKKVKKFKHRKERQKTNRSDLPSSREQSYERQTEPGLIDNVNGYRNGHLSQSAKDKNSKEKNHQNCEDDTLSNLHIELSPKMKIGSNYNNAEDSNENINAICTKRSSSRKDSSASSNISLLTHKQGKENKFNKNETFATSDDDTESEDDKTMSEHQKKKLQKLKKMDLMASDESSINETNLENIDLQNKNKSPSKENDITNKKSIEESCLSNDEGVDNWKITETISSYKENPSDEEDEILPSQQTQKKVQQMKRLNFDDSSESDDSEAETISINKHKSNLIKPEAVQTQNNEKSGKIRSEKSDEESDEVNEILMKINEIINGTINEKSERIHRLSDEDSDREDTILENKVKHLHKKKKIDPMPTDNLEDSDKEDEMFTSRSRKISDEKIKSEDNKDKNKTSEMKAKLHKKSHTDSQEESDSESVHYDSDNVDIKEHKVILPKELKYSNLLDSLEESNLENLNKSSNNDKSDYYSNSKDVNELKNDSDEEIDKIVPAEVSKRMQQLKRLNLYEDSDSSDSDESLKNNRNVQTIPQNSANVSRKERSDNSSDEKENVIEEPPISTDKSNESELNDKKESIEDKVADEKGNVDKNTKVIIPETQEIEDSVLDNIQSQEMFMTLENLEDCPSQIPATPQSKKSIPTKPEIVKITEIDELAEQEELTKSSLEPTISLKDLLADDEEIFLIDVPKHVFNQNVIGKKLVVTNSTLTIGESNYEAFKKGSSPKLSCVMKSKKIFKAVNIRPAFSIIARRKKLADDFIENIEMESRCEKLTSKKNQHWIGESELESVDKVYETESTSTKKSKSKKSKLSQNDKLHSLSTTTLKDSKIAKKKSVKNKRIDLSDVIHDVKSLEESIGQKIASPGKTFKKKLYASDQEVKDIVDSNATDDSSMNTKNSSKKLKKLKKGMDTVDSSIKIVDGTSRNKPALKNLNVNNKTASSPNHKSRGDVGDLAQSKSKTKTKKKPPKKMEEPNPKTEEECKLDELVKSREENKMMFENMFQDSFLLNMSGVEEVPVKKKSKKRKNVNINSNTAIKKRKKSITEEAEENQVAAAQPKKSKKKVEKPKEEPASAQIIKLVNSAFKCEDEKLNTSTSSNESRYGALDIQRISTKKNDSSSSSSDESEEKYSKPTFHVREKSKEKESSKASTSLRKITSPKKEVKDEKKKIKKIYFDE